MRFNMNRKLTFGLASVSFAGLFWACGSGEIMKYDQQTDGVQAFLIENNKDAVDDIVRRAAVQFCDSVAPGDPECVGKLQQGQGNAAVATSSSSAGPTSPYATTSSSAPNQQQQNPISSGNIPITSSPTPQNPTSSGVNPNPQTNPASSSSAPVAADPNAWGTCAANATGNAIKKGGQVQWKLSLDQGKVPGGTSAITQGTFSWTFQDGDPATYSGKGASYLNPLVKYQTSGPKNASVTVTSNGQTNNIQCTPLDVTGADVTGCVCTPSATQVDVAVNGTVTWTVSGCKSSDATFSYVWSDGLSGTNSAGGVLTTKGTFAPTVTVKNNDNGMQVVTCGAVTAIDANNPDYVIKIAGQQGQIDLPASKVTVSLEVDAYNGKIICNSNGPISGTVNSTTQLSGNYYVSVPMNGLKKGTQLVFELASPAKCGVE